MKWFRVLATEIGGLYFYKLGFEVRNEGTTRIDLGFLIRGNLEIITLK